MRISSIIDLSCKYYLSTLIELDSSNRGKNVAFQRHNLGNTIDNFIGGVSFTH